MGLDGEKCVRQLPQVVLALLKEQEGHARFLFVCTGLGTSRKTIEFSLEDVSKVPVGNIKYIAGFIYVKSNMV